jgi:predicted RNA-binding Zn ribbon-like protein
MAQPRTATGPRGIPRYGDVIKLLPGARSVGRTPVARLGWLLRFAQAELPTTAKALQRVDEELGGFLLLSGAQFFTSSARDPESLRKLREELREKLHLVVNQTPGGFGVGTGWLVPYDGLGRIVHKGSITGYMGLDRFATGDQDAQEPTRQQVFMVLAAELVGSPEGKRIQVCAREGCERLFVRRKRGLYCSLKCGSNEQSRKYRERLKAMRRYWLKSKRVAPTRKTNALPKENI